MVNQMLNNDKIIDFEAQLDSISPKTKN